MRFRLICRGRNTNSCCIVFIVLYRTSIGAQNVHFLNVFWLYATEVHAKYQAFCNVLQLKGEII